MRSRKAVLIAFSFLLAACGEAPPATPPPSAAELQALAAAAEAHAGRLVAELRGDAAAMQLGASLFAAHCASCHGSEDGNRKRGVPDLVAGSFDYGLSADAIRATIAHGRQSEMPAMGSTLGEVELGAMVAWLREDLGNQELGHFGGTAQELFAQHCVTCHGADAKGTPALGAPDLTDDYWQHGGEMMNVRLTITRGAESQCPAQSPTLTPAAIELLTGYVLNVRATQGE